MQHGGRTFLPGTLAEWTGLYLFGVGVYGANFRPITRHLTLLGYVPLDWFYLVLLVVGAGLMLFGGPPVLPDPDEDPSGWVRGFALLRVGISLALLGALVWWAIARP